LARLENSIVENIEPQALFGILRQIGSDYFSGLSLTTCQDSRLQRKFLAPTSLRFDPEKIIGIFILDQSFKIIGAKFDEDILGETQLRKNWIELSATRTQTAMFFVRGLAMLKRYRTVNARRIIRLSNGKQVVLQFTIQRIAHNRMQVVFQDMSEIFAYLLNQPLTFV